MIAMVLFMKAAFEATLTMIPINRCARIAIQESVTVTERHMATYHRNQASADATASQPMSMGVPVGICWRNHAASATVRRTHPWDAGCPSFSASETIQLPLASVGTLWTSK